MGRFILNKEQSTGSSVYIFDRHMSLQGSMLIWLPITNLSVDTGLVGRRADGASIYLYKPLLLFYFTDLHNLVFLIFMLKLIFCCFVNKFNYF